MKSKIIIGLAGITLAGILALQQVMLRKASAERSIYRENTIALLGAIETYEVNDSINAVTVGALELKLSELERYRSEDAELIGKLKVDARRLEGVVSVATQTNRTLEARLNHKVVQTPVNTAPEGDSEVSYRNDTIQCIDIHDAWIDISGCIRQGVFTGNLITRDSLVIVEHTRRKRFLGFLWYHGEITERREILSKNPATTITDVEYKKIRH